MRCAVLAAVLLVGCGGDKMAAPDVSAPDGAMPIPDGEIRTEPPTMGPRVYMIPDGGGRGSHGSDPTCRPLYDLWHFVNEGATYCGLVGLACYTVCGTPQGCVEDTGGPIGSGSEYQVMYCPQDKNKPSY